MFWINEIMVQAGNWMAQNNGVHPDIVTVSPETYYAIIDEINNSLIYNHSKISDDGRITIMGMKVYRSYDVRPENNIIISTTNIYRK